MDLKEKASKIKLLVFDVDGVMTDGSITYDENGVEYKTFNAKDGHGLAKMIKNGLVTAVITGRKNGTVDIFSVMYNEANELLIDPVKAAVIGYGEGTVSKKMDEETTIFTF